MIYEASNKPKDGYARLDIDKFPAYEIYTPLPGVVGTGIDQRLVHSVLEMIAEDCPVPRAKVKGEHIVIQEKGGRTRGSPVEGIPSGNDIRKALVKLGYTNRS